MVSFGYRHAPAPKQKSSHPPGSQLGLPGPVEGPPVGPDGPLVGPDGPLWVLLVELPLVGLPPVVFALVCRPGPAPAPPEPLLSSPPHPAHTPTPTVSATLIPTHSLARTIAIVVCPPSGPSAVCGAASPTLGESAQQDDPSRGAA